MSKLLSIIIPTYNCENTLEKCILSIITQKQEFVELIVIDGVSKDFTKKIIKKYEQYIDILLSEEDNGVYDAMNKGVQLSSGQWLYFLGSDDILAPYIIKKIKYILKDKNTIYYGDVYRPKENILYDGKFTMWRIIKKNICHQAIFYPRVVFEKYRYNLKYHIQADYHLNLLCFIDSKLNFYYCNVCIAYYNDESEGVSRNKTDQKFLYIKKHIIKKNFGLHYKIYYDILNIRANLISNLRKIL